MNNDVHYVSDGLTLKQHEDLTAKIKILMETRHSALLRCHRHYNLTNFVELGSGPILAHQVWVANMEMAISGARIAKGNFCTQDTLQQLNIPIIFPSNQTKPPSPNLPHHHSDSSPCSNCHTRFASPPQSLPQDSIITTTHLPLIIDPISPSYLVPYFPALSQISTAQNSLSQFNFLPL